MIPNISNNKYCGDDLLFYSKVLDQDDDGDDDDDDDGNDDGHDDNDDDTTSIEASTSILRRG